MADEITDVFSNNYIFTVCDEEKISFMIEDIRTLSKNMVVSALSLMLCYYNK